MTKTTKTAKSAAESVKEKHNWYYLLYANARTIADYVAFSEKQLKEARTALTMEGKTISRASMELAPIVEDVFHQWQEAEAVLEMLNIQLAKTYKKEFKEFSGKHNLEMSTRDMKLYIEGEPDVVAKREEINTVAYLRNQWNGISKALETKQFQISNVTRMRAAGIEDSEIRFS